MLEFILLLFVLLIIFSFFAAIAYRKADSAERMINDLQSRISFLTNRVYFLEFGDKPAEQTEATEHMDPEARLAAESQARLHEEMPEPPEPQGAVQTDGIYFDEVCHSEANNEKSIDSMGTEADQVSEKAVYKTSQESLEAVPSIETEHSFDDQENGDEPHSSVPAPTVSSRSVAATVDSIEMKLGTYWFVRIGVMLLLTGLAFLAYYKKQFFVELSPAFKVAGFYLLCIAMSSAGYWLSRTHDKLKNFGQVLIAGGFAGVYFTIYASHLFEPIKVIDSTNFAVACLCFWGLFLAWISDRLKSETMAIFTVSASYYATHIPLIHTGEISQWLLLSSNLILAVVSIGFMTKNRWFKLPFVSMIVSYAGFMVTQFGWLVLPLPTSIIFSLSLWSVYSVAAFVSNNRKFSQSMRVWFLSLNNAAMFGLISLAMLRNMPGTFWLASALTSVVMFGMAVLAKALQEKQPLCCKAYTVHGILLLNLGIMTFDMSSSLLGPVFAAESVIFAVMIVRMNNRITRGACLIIALIAAFCASVNIIIQSTDFMLSGLIVSGCLLASSGIFASFEKPRQRLIRPQTGFLAFLGFFVGTLSIGLGFESLSHGIHSKWAPMILIFIPFVAIIANYRLRIREFVILSQACGILGVVISLILANSITQFSVPMLFSCILTLSLTHWWYWQRSVFLEDCEGISRAKTIPNVMNVIYSAGLVGMGLLMTFATIGEGQEWIWFGSVVAVLTAFYSVTTRAFFLGLFSQLFLVFSSVNMLQACLMNGEPDAAIALVPIGAICLVSWLVSVWQWRLIEIAKIDSILIQRIQLGLRVSAAGLAFVWIQTFVPSDWLVLANTLAGIGFFILNSIRNHQDLRSIAGGYGIVALLTFFAQAADGDAFWQSGLALLFLMAFQQYVRRHNPAENPNDSLAISNVTQNCLIVLSGVLTLIWVTIKVSDFSAGEFNGVRTLAWTGLGVVYFATGLGLRERTYRLMGLVTLALALLSIAPSIWSMSTEIKILSVFVMGGVFVTLGFVYSRFKEPLKKLL